MAFGTTYANTFLDADLATAYISLHTADPGTTGASENTETAQGYARQLCAFDAAASKVTQNTAEETFVSTGTAWAASTYWGVWSAVTGGTFYFGGIIGDGGRTVGAGETATLAAGALSITVT